MDWVSEEALAKREEQERCAGNAHDVPDEQVLAMIKEIRELRQQVASSYYTY